MEVLHFPKIGTAAIPAYTAPSYIGESVTNALLSDLVKAVVVIDGGLRDGTAEMLQELQANYYGKLVRRSAPFC